MGTPEDGIKSIRKANKAREDIGLSLLIVKKRRCLKCGRNFNSESYRNRTCSNCKVSMRGWYVE